MSRHFGVPNSFFSPGKSNRKELFRAKRTFHSSFTSCSFSTEQDISLVSQDGNANTFLAFPYHIFSSSKKQRTASSQWTHLIGQETFRNIWDIIFPAVLAPQKSPVTPWSIADLALWFGILWDAPDQHLFEIEDGAFAITSINQNSKKMISTSKCEVMISLYFPHPSSYHISFGHSVGCHMIRRTNTSNNFEVWCKLYGDQWGSCIGHGSETQKLGMQKVEWIDGWSRIVQIK